MGLGEPAHAAVLDDLTASPSGAYGLRKLKSAYAGPVLRIRRSTDNAQQDIGFTAEGDLDVEAIESFAGSGDAFVTVWYDQSGNSANIAQATTTRQPRIAVAGAVVTQNGRPAILSHATCVLSGAINSSGYISYTKSAVVSFDSATADNNFFVIGPPNASGGSTLYPGGTAFVRMYHRSTTSASLATSTTAFGVGDTTVVSALYDQPTHTSTLFQNGANVGSSTNSTAWSGNNTITLLNWNNNGLVGRMCEAMLFNSVLSTTDRTVLESSQLDYWNPSAGAPPPPVKLYAVAGNGKAVLGWSAPSNPAGIVDYLVEYRAGTSGTWTAFPHPASTATTQTVTGLSNDTIYNFRVSSVNATTASIPTSVVTGTPALKTFLHVLSAGQSLSLGNGTGSPITLTQPYDNLMLNGGPVGLSAPLIPLVEGVPSADGSLETPSSGMANCLRAMDSRPIIVGLSGKGATAYSGLKKGTAPYTNAMAQVSATRTYVTETLGCAYQPLAVTLVHGETDYYPNNTTSSYKANLVQWQADYQSDVRTLTGSPTLNLPMFLNQMNCGNTGELAVAQLQAHRENPGKLYLVGPKYQYNYISDHVHLKNTSSKAMGELLAKVMKKVAVDGESWNPLLPTAVVRSGAAITVSYHIPVGNLAIDTTLVAQRANYGFEFVQDGGNAVTITSVELANNNRQVQVTLSAEPTGTNQRLRYAWGNPVRTSDTPSRGFAEASGANYVGGNIRDMDNSVSTAPNGSGTPLYNWSVAFEEPITTPPVVDLQSATSQATEAGPAAGTFVISRSGATTSELTVNYAISGSASNGIDYATLATSATLPAGQSSVTINLTPTADTLAEGNETVTLNLQPDPSYAIGSAIATVTIQDNPYDAWRFQQFGADANDAAIAGALATPAHDDIPNLIKYALGLNPNIPGFQGRLNTGVIEHAGLKYLSLTYTCPDPKPTGASYIVESCDSLDAGGWSSDSTTEFSSVVNAGACTVTVRDEIATMNSPQRFLRLRVTTTGN